MLVSQEDFAIALAGHLSLQHQRIRFESVAKVCKDAIGSFNTSFLRVWMGPQRLGDLKIAYAILLSQWTTWYNSNREDFQSFDIRRLQRNPIQEFLRWLDKQESRQCQRSIYMLLSTLSLNLQPLEMFLSEYDYNMKIEEYCVIWLTLGLKVPLRPFDF